MAAKGSTEQSGMFQPKSFTINMTMIGSHVTLFRKEIRSAPLNDGAESKFSLQRETADLAQ